LQPPARLAPLQGHGEGQAHHGIGRIETRTARPQRAEIARQFDAGIEFGLKIVAPQFDAVVGAFQCQLEGLELGPALDHLAHRGGDQLFDRGDSFHARQFGQHLAGGHDHLPVRPAQVKAETVGSDEEIATWHPPAASDGSAGSA
jgi:hypothetical protein